MRFEKFIKKYSLDKNIIKILEENCRIYLNDLKKQNNKNPVLLYSGRKSSDKFINKKIRKGRSPKDTPKEVHKMIDNEFEKQFGLKPRSNSLFCYPDFNEIVWSYGTPFVIFPKGQYKLLWSPNVTDLLVKIRNYFGIHEVDKINNQDLQKYLQKLIETYKISDASAIPYIPEDNEIMLISQSYYGISYKGSIGKQFKDFLGMIKDIL